MILELLTLTYSIFPLDKGKQNILSLGVPFQEYSEPYLKLHSNDGSLRDVYF